MLFQEVVISDILNKAFVNHMLDHALQKKDDLNEAKDAYAVKASNTQIIIRFVDVFKLVPYQIRYLFIQVTSGPSRC